MRTIIKKKKDKVLPQRACVPVGKEDNKKAKRINTWKILTLVQALEKLKQDVVVESPG